jgi:hypothetical protein
MVKATLPSGALSETDIREGERVLFFRLNESGILYLEVTVSLRPKITPEARQFISPRIRWEHERLLRWDRHPVLDSETRTSGRYWLSVPERE